MQLTWSFIRGLLTLLFFGGATIFFVFWTIKNADDPARMVVKWIVTGLVVTVMVLVVAPMVGAGGYSGAFGGIPLAAVCGLVLAITWRRDISELVAKPIASLYDGGNVPPEPKPAYSIAQSRQKQGRYHEAVIEIQKQLERFPTDFEGHMLLAQIQAEDLKDIDAAGETIDRFCSQPGHAPINIAYALYSLADWHLQEKQDRAGARAAFETVIALLPDTEYAVTAAHRIAHLENPEMPLTEHDRKIFLVPEGMKNVGLAKNMRPVSAPEKDQAELAEELVKHLYKFPMDSEARERLAIIYAEHYGRFDMAFDQLEQLVALPNQPARIVVRCLNRLADLQVRQGADYEAVRATLQRIVDFYPNLAAGENARNRIGLLKLELKAKDKNENVKMGQYEQHIGLRKDLKRNAKPDA